MQSDWSGSFVHHVLPWRVIDLSAGQHLDESPQRAEMPEAHDGSVVTDDPNAAVGGPDGDVHTPCAEPSGSQTPETHCSEKLHRTSSGKCVHQVLDSVVIV